MLIPNQLQAAEGSPSYQIVIPDNAGKLVFPPNETYQYPAEFLQRYIQKTTGNQWPVVKESARKSGVRSIYIGETAFARKAAGAVLPFKPEELAIVPVGNDLVIWGEVAEVDGEKVDRGTLFGVYEFLERQLGVRWYFARDSRWGLLGSGEVTPPGQQLTFPTQVIRSAPAFRLRDGGIFYDQGSMEIQKQWHAVLRFGSTMPHDVANHTQNTWYDIYGKTHPEYFAKDSKGNVRLNHRIKYHNYICLSSDAVYNQMMKNLEDLAAGKDPGMVWSRRPPTKNSVFFCCNDGMVIRNICHCPECAPLLEPERNFEGQASELYFRFIERYARGVKERFPEKRFVTLAYSLYLAPPKNSTIPDNVDLTYVSPKIQYANDPAVYDMHKRYLTRWFELLGKDQRRLTVWMNIVNPAPYTSTVPFAYPHTMQKWLKETRHMVSGYFINGMEPYLRRKARFLADAIQTFPMVYVQGRMLWDPEVDTDALWREFCKNLYGAGADDMYAFYQKIIERWDGYYQTNHVTSELDFIHQVRYPVEQVDILKNLLNSAIAKCKNDDASRKAIQYLQRSIYSRFFKESEKYHGMAGKIPSYDLLPVVGTAPTLDGQGTDAIWNTVPSIRLTRFQWGEKSSRNTSIRMMYDDKYLYFLAQMDTLEKADDLRVQWPIFADGLRGVFATNIDKDWRALREMRIYPDGRTVTYGKYPATIIKTHKGDKGWSVEGAIERKHLMMGTKYMPFIRIQFIRYVGKWDDWDSWSPTVSGISDYPTWKFGILNLLPQGKKLETGLD